MQLDQSFRAALGGAIAMACAMGIGRFVYTPILPDMMQGVPLTASEAGLVASANFVGYLAGALAAAGGWAQGRELSMLRASMFANFLLLGAMGLTTSMPVFLLVRFLAGMVSAFVLIFLTSVLFPRLAASGRPGLQSMQFLGVGFGVAFSAVLTGFSFAGGAPWQSGWYVTAAVSAAGFVASFLLIGPGPAAAVSRVRESRLPASAALYRIIVSYGLFGFGYVITATFLIAIVRAGVGGRGLETAVWIVAGLSAMASVYALDFLGRRAGLVRAYVVGFLLQALGVAASVTVPGAAGPLIGAVLVGGTMVSITVVAVQVGRLLAPTAPRRAFALMTAAFGVGQIVGPIVAGYMAEWTGSFVAPSALAAFVLLVGVAIAWNVETAPKTP